MYFTTSVANIAIIIHLEQINAILLHYQHRELFNLFSIVPKDSEVVAKVNNFTLNGLDYKTLYPGEKLSNDVSTCIIQFRNPKKFY